MPKVSHEVLAAVENAVKQYEQEVKSTALAQLSKATYLLHARHFVRWLDDDFEPGATLRRRNRRHA